MKEKRYELSLIITVDNVSIHTPSGKYWSHSREELPEWLHKIAHQCLNDDAQLCQSISSNLKISNTTT